jgi:hypothetical protein
VLPCVCGSPVEISVDEVCCPRCRRHTPSVASGRLLDVLEKWNSMVGR